MKEKLTETEKYIFSAMWSEHCGYKHSKSLIKKYFKPSEENAGIVWIGEKAVAFKVESHNHPCAVEPFQGAATGIGGIIRDVIAMGARPIALLDSLHFSSPDSHLFEGVVAGISAYGNSIGVPTVGGEVRFSSSYELNPLVNVMAVGIVERTKMRSAKTGEAGASVVLVGSKTGRDGIHGASFASRPVKGDEDRPSVQVGDPFAEKRLIEATLEICDLSSVLAVQDMGAAGILSSTVEMAASSDLGLDLFLDEVPLREDGMEAWEILLSESQERMTFLVSKGKEQEVGKIAQKWDLEFAVIGQTTSNGLFRVFHRGEMKASLPIWEVVNPPDLAREIEFEYAMTSEISSWNSAIGDILLELLRDPTISSKKVVYERYDHTVGGKTARGPSQDAAVLVVDGNKGVALSLDGNSLYTALNAYEGMKAVCFEAVSNVVAVGAKPLGITNCMNFAKPEDENVAADFHASVKGLSDACELLSIPVTGGNVSFYNESAGKSIPPTPVVGVVGVVEDVRKIPKTGFAEVGDVIYYVGPSEIPENGASAYRKLVGQSEKAFGVVNWNACVKRLETVRDAVERGLVVSAHDISDGGLAVSVVEMCLAFEKGVHIETSLHPFEEYPTRFVVEIALKRENEFVSFMKKHNVEFERIGVVKEKEFVWNTERLSLDALKRAYYSLESEENA